MKKILSAVMVIFMVMGLTSCGKSYEDKQAEATAKAKTIYISVMSAMNDNPDIQILKTSVYNMNDHSVMISFDGSQTTDLSVYLGNDYKGYFYAALDPYSRSVEYALWSEYEIDLDYYDYVEYTDRAYFDGTGHAIGYWGY